MAEKLFTEFPAVATQAWEDVIVKDLKGADYEKKLVWRTQEGFTVRPYYRAEDLEQLEHIGTVPGQFPYVRGTKTDNNWLVAQCFCAHESLEKANERAVEALKRGLEKVIYHIDGMKAYTTEDMAVLFKGIDLNNVPVGFANCCCESPALIKAFLQYAKNQGVKEDALQATFDFDPLKRLNQNGRFCNDGVKTRVAECMKLSKAWPMVRTIGVSGYAIRQAGSSLVQELGAMLAMGSEYLNWAKEEGVDTELAARNIQFNACSGSNYFMEIAKFRAARMLWAKIVKAYGASEEACKMMVHAKTDEWNQTVYDMYVNLLRNTTETMSAAIAGVDSIEVTPFDHALRQSTDFSRRLARNTQLVLKEEAHFDKVTDPAGGSYYIENLTASVAAEAWKLFTAMENQGGYTIAFKAGMIQEMVKATAATKDKNLATRRESLLGVNQYPNFTEKANEAITEEVLGAHQCSCSSKCGCEDSKDLLGPAMKPYRDAQSFEHMRWITDRCGKNPKAFMLTFGNLAMCRARAQFSSNFFAVAGIGAIDNNRFSSIEEGVKAALESKAAIVVACSSDDEYAEAVPQIAKLIGDKAIVVVAGEPACKEALQAQGISHFISVRNNVLETLKQYQKELNII